ncbi:MAG: hypothetical protein ACRC57_12775 [Sarcina sp.]
MKVITIKLSDIVHKELKHRMVSEDTTFQEYVSRLIDEDLKKVKKA